MSDLTELVRRVRAHPGLVAKRDLAHVAATVGGDGDDAAVLTHPSGGYDVMAAEAIRPELVTAQPRVAGIAGVVTVLNDIAATGGRAVGILDTVVGPDEVVRSVLEGVAYAANLYRVPVVGGHTTVRTGEAALSTFALGRAKAPLRAANARVGDVLSLVTCLDGQLVEGPDGALFFSHLRGTRAADAPDDLACLPAAAEAGDAWACRDISMPGLVGSLVQFLESAGGLGCRLDVDAIPVPSGTARDDWLCAFPSFGFLVCGDPQALAARFAGLHCAPVGVLDGSGVVRVSGGGDEAVVWDLGVEPLAALRPER